MAIEPEKKLFGHAVFAFVINKDLPESQALACQESLEDNGGTVVRFHEKMNLERVTHIISETSDFKEYEQARLQMIPVVKPTWIMHSVLKQKEASIRPFTPDPKLIFSDVHLTCADIPSGDKDAIIGAVLAMGGMESSSLMKVTTHICALTLDHPKCQQALEKNLKVKIVLPHWFDDCLKLGKRIDEKPYLLPDPEVLRLNPEDALPFPTNEDIIGASSPHPDNLPLPTNSPVRRLTVFNKRKIMISQDFQLSSRTRKVIEDLIEGGGGAITNSVHNADIYVCHWREGRDYVFASRAGIDVGNLSWLYHLITNNEWTSPMRRLLHYPLPKEPLKGFEGFRITLSNYGGEARTYLENLITAAGAEFTKSMKPDNTHLITARKNSEKCQAADEWNIEMVNHLWIEESYAKSEMQKLSDPRYTTFPPRTNLGEIIGQTQFDPQKLEEKYFPRDPTPSPGDPKPLRRPVMHEKDRNASSRKSNADVAMGGQDDEIEKVVKKKAGRRASSRSSLAQVTTPAPNRRISAGKENDTPSPTGSRSAKEKAVSRLHGLADDIALYEKEKKRKGPIWGGERAANKVDKERSAERSSSPGQKHEADEEFSDEEDHNPKRQRVGPKTVGMKLLITGYKEWIGAAAKEDADKKKLRELGVLVTQDPKACTHLAAPNLVRTKKFLCALASGPIVISTDFIDACVKGKKGDLPDAEDFLLKDTAKEKDFGVKLKDVVVRAKANKRCLLRRVPVYITKELPNGAEYREIIEANGGTFSVYTGKVPSIKKVNPEEDEGPVEPVYLISGQKPDERKLWPKFTTEAKEGNMMPRIVDTEWLLDVALSQQQKWSDRYLVEKK
ncbi:BRCT domain-containing protein [Hyaloscypha variabilis F]|uniref:BRCT domain-containing protein n=1 Tax=Hyaloscypha variabilis (strain UAMH 11265 / GT02V1 / F) TaxID=1149755 RepID=A0A2J6SC48_HYAVF|nr:BRCT domain-containing protein [Hyaloscypha variabilis F]